MNDHSFIHQVLSWNQKTKKKKRSVCITSNRHNRWSKSNWKKRKQDWHFESNCESHANKSNRKRKENKRDENGFRLDQLITEVDQHVKHGVRFSFSFFRSFDFEQLCRQRRRKERLDKHSFSIWTTTTRRKFRLLPNELFYINDNVSHLNNFNNTKWIFIRGKKFRFRFRSFFLHHRYTIDRSRSTERKFFRMNESSCSIQQMFSFNGHERTHSFVHFFDCVRCD